jgi:hypothetical protein
MAQVLRTSGNRFSNVWKLVRLAAVAACVVLTGTRDSTGAGLSYIYGIDDDNYVWEVDPAGKTYTRALNTGLTGLSNAFAYDTARDDMYFLSSGKELYYWNHGSTFAKLSTREQLGLGTGITQPANAAYYADAYWFFNEGANTLNKASLNYSDNVPTSVASLTTYAISGIPGTISANNLFGDIAINGNTGVLYAATTTGLFYSVDLGALSGGAGTASVIKSNGTGNPSLQIAFSSDYATLYATNYAGGQWYTMDVASGNVTSIPGFQTQLKGSTGFRDLGGSSIAPVPEPSTWALLFVAAGAIGVRRWRGAGRRRGACAGREIDRL